MVQTLDKTVAVGTVRTDTTTISKIVTLVAVVVPPLGLLSAMGLLWGVAFHPVDLAIAADREREVELVKPVVAAVAVDIDVVDGSRRYAAKNRFRAA